MLQTVLLLLATYQETPYQEPLRPQFHFTAKAGWLNDPNGLVYYRGEYHLFFQHNPFGTQWGNMTWGHAVSKDLVHWKQVENAIEPDGLGTAFSGSAVVEGSRLVCIYTAAGGTNEASKGKPFTQCLAFSSDGRTFKKADYNPVLPHIEAENRDPKVIWHEPSKRWIMALYLNESRFALFNSLDLIRWERLSNVDLPGASECPDFFPLPLGGNKKQMKWVFWGGNGIYRVGNFDGITFHPETDSIPSIFGNTGYAAQTFFNDPKGRRVQISWHNNANFPGTTWNQEMGFPTELRLVSTPAGPRLTFRPVEEVKSLRARRVAASALFFEVDSGLMDATLQVRVPSTGKLVLEVNGHDIQFDAAIRKLTGLGKSARVEPIEGVLSLRILADRASIEVFAQDGLVSMPFFALPVEGATRGLRVRSSEEFKVEKAEVWELKGAWVAK